MPHNVTCVLWVVSFILLLVNWALDKVPLQVILLLMIIAGLLTCYPA